MLPAETEALSPGVRQRPSPTAPSVAPSPASPAQAAERPESPTVAVVASWARSPPEKFDWPPNTVNAGSFDPDAVWRSPSWVTR